MGRFGIPPKGLKEKLTVSIQNFFKFPKHAAAYVMMQKMQLKALNKKNGVF